MRKHQHGSYLHAHRCTEVERLEAQLAAEREKAAILESAYDERCLIAERDLAAEREAREAADDKVAALVMGMVEQGYTREEVEEKLEAAEQQLQERLGRLEAVREALEELLNAIQHTDCKACDKARAALSGELSTKQEAKP